MSFLSSLWHSLKNIVKKIGDVIGKILKGIWNGIKHVASWVWKHRGQILTGIFVGYSVFGEKVLGIKNLVGGDITKNIKNFWEGLGNFIKNVSNKVKYVYDKVAKSIEPIVMWLKRTYERLVLPVINWVNKYANKIQNMLIKFNKVATVISYFKEGKILKGLLAGIKLTNEKLYNTIRKTLQNANDNIIKVYEIIGSVLGKVKSDINKTMQKVENIGQIISDTAKKLGIEKLDNLGIAIEKIASKVIKNMSVKVGNIQMKLSDYLAKVTNPLNVFLMATKLTEKELEKWQPIIAYSIGRMLTAGRTAKVYTPKRPKWVEEYLKRYGG